jgi:hypothetical protein
MIEKASASFASFECSEQQELQAERRLAATPRSALAYSLGLQTVIHELSLQSCAL